MRPKIRTSVLRSVMIHRNIYLTLLYMSFFYANQPMATTIPEDASQVRMYVVVTPSHEQLFHKWFRPTLQDKYELVVKRSKQDGAAGNYMGHGWTHATLKKVNLILEAIKENWGKPFVFSDVDIQFFRPTWPTLAALLKDYDMLTQLVRPQQTSSCTGFFVCVGNERTLEAWQAARSWMLSRPSENKNDDQYAFNAVMLENPTKLKLGLLPDIFMPGYIWRKQKRLPEGILLHHANFAIGIDSKIKQLKEVRRKFAQIVPRANIPPSAVEPFDVTRCNLKALASKCS